MRNCYSCSGEVELDLDVQATIVDRRQGVHVCLGKHAGDVGHWESELTTGKDEREERRKAYLRISHYAQSATLEGICRE